MSTVERPIDDRLTDARRYAQMARQIAESTDALPDIRILAIRHCLMLVGEALDFVPDEIFAHEPLIPWRRVIALRHRLIHGYWLMRISSTKFREMKLKRLSQPSIALSKN